LRPVVVLPPQGQVLVIRAILAHQVPANKVATLVRALADGGESALRRALVALGLPSPRGRVASSYSRLPAVPADWEARLQLVAQELRTIRAPRARRTRLAQLAEQAQRLEAVAAAYRALLRDHGFELTAEPAWAGISALHTWHSAPGTERSGGAVGLIDCHAHLMPPALMDPYRALT